MSAVLQMDYTALSANPVKLTAFKTAYTTALVTKLNATSVIINSMVAGSVVSKALLGHEFEAKPVIRRLMFLERILSRLVRVNTISEFSQTLLLSVNFV